MNMIQERLNALRKQMSRCHVDAWLIPSADYHGSEYAGEHFKIRAFMSGFTGSAGTLLVTDSWAGLWTDGRYFIQAARQLQGSGIELMPMGEPGVPTVEEYLAQNMEDSGCLGFDGRVVSVMEVRALEAALQEKQIRFKADEDLAGPLWTERPPMPKNPAFLLGETYSGMSAKDKLAQLRQDMKARGAQWHVMTALDEIGWLFNMRGNDIACTPVVLAYAVIGMEQARLYIHQEVLDDGLREQFRQLNVELCSYDDILDGVKELKGKGKVLIDPYRTNYGIYQRIDAGQIVEGDNPCMLRKAVKNPTEMENERKAHLKDGAAMVKFLWWVKTNVGKIPMTELTATAYVDQCRKEQEHFIDNSFSTIVAYGEHAAMCHYSATEETSCPIEPRGLLLIDSGGHYLEGTTDITRTIALGPVTDEERLHYTLVLKGMIALARARFLYGARGINLDYLARQPLWERGLDFLHGTGHGVGYLLGVHESPNNFRWKMQPGYGSAVLEEGMLTSDEPGYYEENSHGIRTENLLLCRKDIKTQYGQFMSFETVTMAPIDLEPVDFSLMTAEEINWLNAYHQEVYEKISPLVEPEAAAWLKEVTRPVAL